MLFERGFLVHSLVLFPDSLEKTEISYNLQYFSKGVFFIPQYISISIACTKYPKQKNALFCDISNVKKNLSWN